MGKHFIEFVLLDEKPKTKVYEVVNIEGIGLGVIQWYGGWRSYCFYPYEDRVLSSGCLQDISTFITQLMDARKVNKT